MTAKTEFTEIHDRDDFVKAAKADPYGSLYVFKCDPREIFDFEVIDGKEEMSWGESFIGTNLGCVTDYGRHWDMSDEELIQKVVEGWTGFLTPQYLGFMNKEKTEVTETVRIIRKNSGYVKCAKF